MFKFIPPSTNKKKNPDVCLPSNMRDGGRVGQDQKENGDECFEEAGC